MEYSNNNNKNKWTKRVVIGLVIFVLVISGLAYSMSKPKEAEAGVGEVIQLVIKNVFDLGQKAVSFADKQIEKIGSVAFKNALQRFMNNVAFKAATELSTAGPGNKPLFANDWGDWAEDQAYGALGDYLNSTLGKMWGKNLCEPLNPVAKVNIEMAVRRNYTPQAPKCDARKIWSNIESLTLNPRDLVDLSSGFHPNTNQIGIAMIGITGGEQKRQEELAEKKWTQILSGDMLNLTGKINGKILTPASIIKADFSALLGKKYDPQTTYTGNMVADAVGVFGNTLANKLMERLYKEGLNPLVNKYKNWQNSAGGSGGSYAPSGEQNPNSYGYGDMTPYEIAQQEYADLLTVDYNYSGPIDLLNQLSCGIGGQYDCTIDTSLRTVLEGSEYMTVGEALSEGYLHGEYAFGFWPEDRTGGNDKISDGIYSYRGIKILRKYRIVPIGWELAAEYYEKYDKSRDRLTLVDLVNYYDDTSSPYYRLVDPDWILKAPETICYREGSGPFGYDVDIPTGFDEDGNGEIDDDEFEEVVTRQDYCADERSCVRTIGGECLTGYCTKEEFVWRMEGEECSPQYNSCQSFTSRKGTQMSYVTNTLWGTNDEPCNAGNVGCREYCLWKDYDDEWSCGISNMPNDTLYMNYRVGDNECGEDQAGCTEMVRMTAVQNRGASNWIPNSSFEAQECDHACTVEADYFRTQFMPGSSFNVVDSIILNNGSSGDMFRSKSGDYSLMFTTNGVMNYGIETGMSLGGKTFVLSGYFYSDQDTWENDFSFELSGDDQYEKVSEGDWTRVYIIKQYDKNNTDTKINISIRGSSLVVDDLSLTEDIKLRPYAGYSSANKVNLRKAPDYLGCDRFAQVNDKNEINCEAALGEYWRSDIQKCVEGGSYDCYDYALFCDSDDVGCEFYRPVSDYGDPIPGVGKTIDSCPSECVSYDTFEEQRTPFEIGVPNMVDIRTVQMIPSTANVCSAAEAGCESFTNLSEGSEGEKIEYYKTMRACVKSRDDNGQPNPNVRTYYSWSAGEGTGYELGRWELLMSNLGDEAPCTNVQTLPDGTVQCVDSSSLIAETRCEVNAVDPDNNPIYNPDCVDFEYNGNTHWVKYSKIVLVQEECTLARRTFDQNLYSFIPGLSQTCQKKNVGCREYKGSQSERVVNIFDDGFEDDSVGEWASDPGSDSLSIARESLNTNGRSLKVPDGETVLKRDVAGLLEEGKSYKLSFWAKSENTNNTIHNIYMLSTEDTINFKDANGIVLNANWNYYEFDLVDLKSSGGGSISDGSLGSFVLHMELHKGKVYIDNIKLEQGVDSYYLIRNSWTTPLSCDNPLWDPEGRSSNVEGDIARSLPGEMLGCRSYKNSEGDEVYYKSFSKLCHDEMVGCEMFIDTKNTSEVHSQSFADYTIEADELVYMVYDEDKKCREVGCINMGRLLPSMVDEINYEDVTLLVDYDNFGSDITPQCGENEVWCEEFVNTDGPSAGLSEYFKDPNIKLCEYKEVDGIYGWYIIESSTLCPSFDAPTGVEGNCLGGRSKINSSGENNTCFSNADCVNYADTSAETGTCSNWVAVCPSDQSGCLEYQDPANPKGCDKASVNGEKEGMHPNDAGGEACDFYYYKSVETCDTLNPSQGCYGFHNTDPKANADYMFSTARCSGDPGRGCETDSDCLDAGSGFDFGPCTYDPAVIDINDPVLDDDDSDRDNYIDDIINSNS